MFENIIGQKKVKALLSKQIKSGKFSHAYIFMGQKGVGKRQTAIEFAKILNCSVNDFTKTDAGACGICPSCIKATKNGHPDIHFIDFAMQAQLLKKEVEKQTEIRVDVIREMKKEVLTKTHESKFKFFIIEPAEKMNMHAANSLLKTLEEPPDNTIIILLALHKETIPQTILSRSQTVFFQPLEQDDISSYLMLTHGASAQKAKNAAALSEGSIENAEKLLEDTENQGLALWLQLKNEDLTTADIMDISRSIDKEDALEYIDAMTAEAKKDFRLYPSSAIKTLEYLNFARFALQRNANTQTVFDNLFFDLDELKKSSKMFKEV